MDSDVGVATGGAAEATKTHAGDGAGSGSPSEVGNKRRCMLSEGNIIVLTGMTDAVNNVASAIRETKVENSHPELYGAVMFIPGFTDEALMAAYNHLPDNKAQGTAFVKMNDSLCVVAEALLDQALLHAEGGPLFLIDPSFVQ